MELYLIKAYWKYEDSESIVGICDTEHIEILKTNYCAQYDLIKDSIRCFEVEKYILNEVC